MAYFLSPCFSPALSREKGGESQRAGERKKVHKCPAPLTNIGRCFRIVKYQNRAAAKHTGIQTGRPQNTGRRRHHPKQGDSRKPETERKKQSVGDKDGTGAGKRNAGQRRRDRGGEKEERETEGMRAKAWRHFWLVVRHRHKVLAHCARCGILWRGLVHDLSKFSPTEFIESARYYTGTRSPIGVCRRERGVSLAWLHHKGRNKHHIEYWVDDDCETQPRMPYPYAVECVCDKLAATKTYAGKNYNEQMPLAHWLCYGCHVRGNPRNLAFVEQVFRDLAEHGEDFILRKRYMQDTYRRIMEEPDGKAQESGNPPENDTRPGT